jgi:alpha-glucosidase
MHTDTGGFDPLSLPLANGVKLTVIARSKELLLRWMELSAFTPVFRTHEGIDPTVAWQFDGDAETLAFFARMATVYRAWGFYRKDLVAEAARTGHPVLRHPFLHYPDDPTVRVLQYQWLLGSELLVAPVLDEGADQVRLYLPAGDWTHLWTGETFGSPTGTWTDIAAPLGRPAVFAKRDSAVGTRFRAALRNAGIM